MENLTIIVIVITLTVILFSSISYSYVSPDQNAQIPIDMLNSTGKARTGVQMSNIKSQNRSQNRASQNRSQIDTVGKVNPYATTYALYNLPEKDEYMTPDLRNQIDTLRTQYYYDNCQPSPFSDESKINPKLMTEKFDACPTNANITFVDETFVITKPINPTN